MTKQKKKSSKKKPSKQKPATTKKLYIATTIALILGIIIGITATGTTVKTNPSLIQTSCDINIQSLYEKPCSVTEDCYGRLELCSVSLKRCMTTVQADKTDIRNIRIPSTQKECEANAGTWKVEIIETE